MVEASLIMDTKLQPLVSVIIPIYNRVRFLPQLFGTLKQQTYSNLEIIIVDDGSHDGSKAWIEHNKSQLAYDTIYIEQDNSGPYAARNNGLKHSSGKYIAFQDSDDEWPNDHIFNLVTFLEGNDEVDWVFGAIERIEYSTGNIVEPSNLIGRKNNIHPFLRLKTIQVENFYKVVDDSIGKVSVEHCVPGSTQCALIRSTVFEHHKFDETFRTAYDRFFAMKLAILGFKFAYTTEIHQIYHIHDNHISLVAGASDEKLKRSAETMLRGYEQLRKLSSNPKIHHAIAKETAKIYAWQISIAEKNLGNYKQSSLALKKAFMLYPQDIRYMKSWAVSILRALFKKNIT